MKLPDFLQVTAYFVQVYLKYSCACNKNAGNLFSFSKSNVMNKTTTRNKYTSLTRTFRLLVEQLLESFESPQARQFRLLKKFVAE